ncbi:MAG TPA: aspartate dehydrogenase [Patescibacteria group bacterium]|nr:aspartate dehydrogenase [Patescibacteria group bacterium]
MKKVGVIGCGAIGTLIAQSFAERLIKCDELLLYDKDIEKARKLQDSPNGPITPVSSVDEMIRAKPIVIVEAASQQAVKEYLHKILSSNIEMVVMSVGALLDMDVKSKRVHIPSGAIGGLDAISTAALVGIQEIVLTTRKHPKTLNLTNVSEKTAYEGSAKEAVKLFPREMNVAATLALTVKPHEVKVRVISDPKVTRNIHEISLLWKHGNMLFRFENDPHPENPGTSALAAWSAINLIKELLEK